MGSRVRESVVGAGSMGKRRIRNVKAIGGIEIAAFDPRADRRAESVENYRIIVYDDLLEALDKVEPNVLIISTSPEHHMHYINIGFDKGLSCFVEASVVDAAGILDLHRRAEKTDILIGTSCTMRYFPGPRKVKELIRAGVIGRTLNVNYQIGQYLPDWHPWERLTDFYVSRRVPGVCREIVPFVLTWLDDLLGAPVPLSCVNTRLTDMDAGIDDIYHCLMRYSDDVLANITVEVISRPHTSRELRILGSEGEIVLSGDENVVRYANADHPEWMRFDLGSGTVGSGYVYPEEPYIAETRDLITAVSKRDKRAYPNTLLDDYAVLQVLYKLEQLSEAVQ